MGESEREGLCPGSAVPTPRRNAVNIFCRHWSATFHLHQETIRLQLHLDRDGTLDMLFASCASVSPSSGIGSTCSINIAYNKQLPLCASATTPSIVNGKRVCRPPDNLCTADPEFGFDLSDRADNDVRSSSFSPNKLLTRFLLGLRPHPSLRHLPHIPKFSHRPWAPRYGHDAKPTSARTY